MRVQSTPFTNDAAAVWACSNTRPEIVKGTDGFSEFIFPATPEVRDAFERYNQGGLLLDAKLLLTRRAALLKLVKDDRKGGGCFVK